MSFKRAKRLEDFGVDVQVAEDTHKHPVLSLGKIDPHMGAVRDYLLSVVMTWEDLAALGRFLIDTADANDQEPDEEL